MPGDVDYAALLRSLGSAKRHFHAPAAVAPRLPPTGWFDRALVGEELFVDAALILGEWPA
ncbi:hypothetical protein Aph01nite_01180 [Acrocarpospora phusangensis]|uniref:Uncharacterized protein n=1 Tax=Acrocarpospora phusangensis TaxID=1070424 RepID=A0A919Q6F0_9ACTN|nr:hypothetical protein [Acrocarpospora phusangensis]GIH21808.1 hypothetical protein Aph01nite_01180 [Acrocarpospora phusangensis]